MARVVLANEQLNRSQEALVQRLDSLAEHVQELHGSVEAGNARIEVFGEELEHADYFAPHEHRECKDDIEPAPTGLDSPGQRTGRGDVGHPCRLSALEDAAGQPFTGRKAQAGQSFPCQGRL